MKDRKLNLFIVFFLCATGLFAQKTDHLKFVSAQELELLGRAFDNTEGLYGRLPLDMKDEYREVLWNLGKNTSGVAVRFSSNAKVLGVKWSVLNDFSMAHMASTGIKGIDLYVLENGKWHYLGIGRPVGEQFASVIIGNMEGAEREYLAYLPLYDAATSLEFGCDSSAFISKPKQEVLRSYKVTGLPPIVFYGTSIVQGGCASRPGMVHTSIIGRALQTDVINLGFSGNARCDKSILKTLQRIDAKAYILDFLPNCNLQMIKDSAEYFIYNLAEAKPEAVIYLVENLNFPPAIASTKVARELKEENEELYAIYEKLKKQYKNLVYIKTDNILGTDGEATVDGVHLTDLGFMRFAEHLLKYIK